MPSIKKSPTFFVSLTLILLAGCAFMEGSPNQDLEITSTPSGAACAVTQADKVLWKHGMVTGHENVTFQTIGNITTPATLNVQRTGADIHITCTLPGYQETAMTVESYQSAWGASDSPNTLKYNSPVNVVMKK